MTSALRRTRPLTVLALAVVAVLAALTALPASTSFAGTADGRAASAPMVAGASPASSAHPFSIPAYFPLRNPALVSCVYDNCPGGYHGHWAINFIGHLNDPIYAAGAGIFHVGAVSPSCSESVTTQGTWVYVDHGAGGVTRYMHLNTIVAKEGQLVTPDTVIGTMGASGNGNCRTDYVDIEWRADRLGGTREPIPAMSACEGSKLVSFPSALGYSSWNSTPHDKITTPQLSGDCHPTWDQTPARPTISLVRSSDHTILENFSAKPAGVTAVRVWMEEYHPSLHAYDTIPTLRDVPVAQGGTHWTGLLDGRDYRFSVAYENHAGWSNWAPVLVTTPAA
jgi:hypothetical protein